MTWRIKEIGIYPRKTNSACRKIRLKTEGVNIITGRSGRGKSALLDIVSYCLLSKNCSIAKGVIRDSVSHVGLLLSRGQESLSIIRPIPDPERVTSTQIALHRGTIDSLPDIVPEINTNLENAKDELSTFTGIEALPILTNDRTVDPEAQFPANIRHCACYLFQPQDVIASRNTTFPGLENSFEKRHVVDALNYFLRVITSEDLQLRRELLELIQERNSAQRQLREHQNRTSSGLNRGLSLWNEAVVLGIINTNEQRPSTVDEVTKGLKQLAEYRISTIEDLTEPLELRALTRRESDLRTSLRQKRRDLSEIRDFVTSSQEAESIAGHQANRISMRDLLPTDSNHACPVCGNDHIDISDIENQLEEGLSILNIETTPDVRLRSKLENRATLIEREISEISSELQSARERLQALYEELSAGRILQDEAERRIHLVGQAQEYLQAMESILDYVGDDLGKINERISELEARVGENALHRRRQEVEGVLNSSIAEICKHLDVEFPDAPVRLNFRDFVIQIQLDNQWLSLNELGSGANWLVYHIATTIALHLLFIQRRSPVPSFIMLDQPSQVWFPSEIAQLKEQKTPENDNDLQAVHRVYDYLFSVAKDGPQIIVVDHARLANDEFSRAIVEDWHNELGLVPDTWQ